MEERLEEDRLERFSPTSLQSYRNCPLQFYYGYVMHLARKKEQTIEAVLGTCVHRALEEVYHARQRGRVLRLEATEKVYEREWARALLKGVRIIARGTPEEYHEVGLRCVRDYWRGNAPFDADHTVSVERHVGFELPVADPAGPVPVLVHGYIDRLSIGPDGVFEIHDYKTNRSLPTVADKEADWQLAIYASALRRLWPGIGDVRLVWHFVRHQQKIVVTHRLEQQEPLEQQLRELIGQIRKSQRGGSWPCRRSALCDWCDFREECPLFKHEEAALALPEDERHLEAGVGLVDQYAALEVKKKNLREQMGELDDQEKVLAGRLLKYGEDHKLLDPGKKEEQRARLAGTDFFAELHLREDLKFPTRTAAPKKVEEMEAELKGTLAWLDVSRLDTRTLLDARHSGRLAGEALARVEAWLEKWGHKETHRTVKLHKRRAALDD